MQQARALHTTDVGVGFGAHEHATGPSVASRLRAYFGSDTARTVQTLLGLIWLLDAGLQFQSFMYSSGFIHMLTSNATGQPAWLASSIKWGAHIAQGDLSVWNTLFALTQVLIGAGLLWRPTVKPAIAFSCVWAVIVWWFGEAFGMLFMNMASPLTGAPGAVILYGVIALLVWPNDRPGGLLGVRGARTVWTILWLLSAWLWLLGPNTSASATRSAINAAPSGMSWLSTVQDWAANAAKGNGLPIAIVLAACSVAVGVAVGLNWRPKPFLALGVLLSLAYWILGQGLGGIFQGGGTDPNAGPLFVLLAFVIYALIRDQEPAGMRAAPRASPAALGG